MQIQKEVAGHGKGINIKISQVYHWPTLKTVLMVEKVLKDADLAISIEELKRRLPTKIMDQSLRLILAYLDSKGYILADADGIVWIKNDDPRFLEMIKKSKGIRL